MNESVPTEIAEEVTEVVTLEQDSPIGETPEPIEEPQPKPVDSGFIDFDQLPDEHRDKVKMRIDSDFRKNKELERKAQEYERKLREMEAKMAESAKPQEVAPPTQDDWYEDPEAAKQKQQAYADSITAKSQWEHEQKLREQRVKDAEMQEQVRIQNELFEKAKSAGIEENKLRYSAAVLMNSGIAEDTAKFLVSHDYAPQLINHLAENPVELQTIASLNAYEVGVKLNDMANAYKPKKRSSAPAPDAPIRGNTVESEDPLLKGAKIF